MRYGIVLVCALLAACNGGKDETTTEPTESDTDTDADTDTDTDTEVVDSAEPKACGDTPPVLQSITLAPRDNGGDAVQDIFYEVTDADGALHEFAMFIWYDTEVDGFVSTTGSALSVFPGAGSACDVTSVSGSAYIPLEGVGMAYDTLYEGLFVMEDADGLRSNTLIVAFCSASADGSAGDCTPDTGATDTGRNDTGSTDTGAADTGSTDTGSTDTGTNDTATDDTGSAGPPDYDGDGIPDALEGNADVDGDGLPNWRDTDSDGDGRSDLQEGTDDPDNDGRGNWVDVDSDGDGVLDIIELNVDLDGDGQPNVVDADDDGDGIPTTSELNDGNGNGIPDYLEP